MPRRASTPVLALLLLWAGVRAQEPERSYPEGIVAIVEGDPITRHELELLCRLANPEYRLLPPDHPKKTQLLGEQLDVLVQERVLLLRAKAEGVELGPEDEARLGRELEREAERYGGAEGLRLALDREGVPLPFLQQRLRSNLLVTKLLLKHISRDVFVTPEEVRRYYEDHRAAFTTKGLLRLRQIVVFPQGTCMRSPRPALLEQALASGAFDGEAYAASLRTRVLGGEPFEAVARGGSMGDESSLVMDFKGSDDPAEVLNDPLPQAVQKLAVGEPSQVIRSETGTLHLLLVEERTPPGPRPLGAVQHEIEAQLKDELWDRRVKDWIEAAKRDAVILKFFPPK